jgi:hypothetical protein
LTFSEPVKAIPSASLPAAPGNKLLRWEILAVLCVMVVCAGIRWRLRAMPLERDEGEYSYMGQLMLQGAPPYKLAYNMKLPGTYTAYALMMRVFGETAAGIRLGLLVTNALTILLIYAIGRRLFGPLAATVSAVSYAIFSVGPGVNGFAAHATHFVVFVAAAGLWLLVTALEKPSAGRVFIAGLCMGMAFLMKQPGAVFAIFGGWYLLQRQGWSTVNLRKTIRPLTFYALGAVLPYAATCLFLWRAGVFARFWFWTVDYASQYSAGPAEARLFFMNNFPQTVHSAIALWTLAAFGATSLVWSLRARRHAKFLLSLTAFSLLGVSAGFYFRWHYFILLLPALSFLVGVGIDSATDWGKDRGTLLRAFPVVIFVLACLSSLLQEEYFFFRADPVAASRFVYPVDPFPEAAALGDYLRQHSASSEKIAVLGNEPEVLFYANRHSATGYMYTYSLMEEQKYASAMQREMISEIEAARPDYIVFVRDWMILPHSDRSILAWSDQYLKQNYDLAGIMRERDGLQLRSPAEIAGQQRKMDGAMFLFQRKTSQP